MVSWLSLIALYVECSLTFVKHILHIRLLEFPVFSCITKSHNKVSKEDAYRVAWGETNSSHWSLLILGGQVGTRRGRSVSGRGEVEGGSEHCATVLSLSARADELGPYRGLSFLFACVEHVFMCEWANVFRTLHLHLSD